jgi:hypothetical protein
LKLSAAERAAAQPRRAFHIHPPGMVALATTLAEIGAELMADIRLI